MKKKGIVNKTNKIKYSIFNRQKKKRKCQTPALKGCPQKKGICIRVYETSPKKPNSAVRKVAKIFLTSTKNYIIAGIPGEGHFLSDKKSVVLVRGGRVNDVPGVRYKIIKGKYDMTWRERIRRSNRRSKYGTPRNQDAFF